MKPTIILLALLTCLLAACSDTPEEVADAWTKALAAGDIDAALSYLAEDAQVQIVIGGPNGEGVYNGHQEIRGWYETIVGAKGSGTLSNCNLQGDTLTCLNTYSDDGLKSMGVDFIEGEWVGVIKDGKIQSYVVTITPESLAKFPPPLPSPEEVADAWTIALADGDIDLALSYLAEQAEVSIIPVGPDGDGVYQGHEEIRGWYETIVAANGVGTLQDCTLEGDTYTCLNIYSDDGLKSMGVDFIEGEWVAVIRDGKIQSYVATILPESLAKFPAEPAVNPEVRVTSPEQIAGEWEGHAKGYDVLHNFALKGDLLVDIPGIGRISDSKFWFEDDLLNIEDMTGGCENIIASYEVYATIEGENATQLRFVLVGEDACSDRYETLAGKTLISK